MAYEENREFSLERKDNIQETSFIQTFRSCFVKQVDNLEGKAINLDSIIKGKWLSDLLVSLIQKCKLLN